ncbi:hypothetical protein [Lysobacter gummosus]
MKASFSTNANAPVARPGRCGEREMVGQARCGAGFTQSDRT